jgi:hypothetical protein
MLPILVIPIFGYRIVRGGGGGGIKYPIFIQDIYMCSGCDRRFMYSGIISQYYIEYILVFW